MFSPDKTRSDSDVQRTSAGPPPSFIQVHGMLGMMFSGAGFLGMIYGWMFAHQATPAVGQGLIAGLLGGLIASLGHVFATMGWILFCVGMPLATAAWGWRKKAAWARPLTQFLGLVGALFGLWILVDGQLMMSLVPFSYAVWVGWVLGR